MLDGLQQLMDLQALDDRRAELRGRLDGIPERRAALEEARAAAEAEVTRAGEALQAAEAEQRRAETELQDQEALVTRLEGQQSQVKTNEAYSALLHEIDAAKEAISGFETVILETMDTIEGARTQRAEAEAGRDEQNQRADAESKALDEQQSKLEAEHADLDGQREALCGTIDASFLDQYDKIARKHGSGVARVHHETCQGCRVNIPPQMHIELLRGESLITCQRCKRILIPEK